MKIGFLKITPYFPELKISKSKMNFDPPANKGHLCADATVQEFCHFVMPKATVLVVSKSVTFCTELSKLVKTVILLITFYKHAT
jgi:hypothetical protein